MPLPRAGPNPGLESDRMTRHCANPECPALARDGAAAEYVDRVVRCLDCGEQLMRGPAPEDPAEPARFTDYQTVFIASDPVQAHLVRGLIEAEKIVVYLKGESLASAVGELPVTVKQVEVQVSADERERALEIVHRFEASLREARDPG